MGKKCVLAYSGGLDTSCILLWLIEQGFECYCFVGLIGQEDDFEAVKAKALKIGAKDVFIVDCRRQFVTDYIFPAIQANAIYEGRYLLGTSLARPALALELVRVCHKIGAKYVSHGATGKGNDQVRFELCVAALDPELEIVAPWRMPEFFNRFEGRTALLQYAEEKGIPVPVTLKAPYSMDENLYHISYESGVLEDPASVAPREMYRMTADPRDAPGKEDIIQIHFKDGVPCKLVLKSEGDAEVTDPLEIMLAVNRLGKKHGIGRIDIVENRFVGIKSRGVYETPGGTILMAAHRDIEGLAMDREVMRLRDMLATVFAEKCYNGFWFSPEMDFLRASIQQSQELIDGHVDLMLYKASIHVLGRSSPTSLYDQDLSSMDVAGGFNPQDSEGFIRINSIRLKAHRAICLSVAKKNPDRVSTSKPSYVDLLTEGEQAKQGVKRKADN